MQVQNHTQQILVFGKCQIEPNGVGRLPDEFEDHPTVAMLLRLRKIGPVGPVASAPSILDVFLPAPKVESPTAPAAPRPQTLTFSADESKIPPAWDELHGNKKRAWINRQQDRALLGKVHMLESSDKIRSIIMARIDTLEARA